MRLPTAPPPQNLRWSTGERRGRADRRLGERRLQSIRVDRERRLGSDRRKPVGRRESAGGHIRNAIQVLETALMESEHTGDLVERQAILAAIARLKQALLEVDRLTRDRSHLGQLFRVTERGLPLETLPGLKSWLS